MSTNEQTPDKARVNKSARNIFRKSVLWFDNFNIRTKLLVFAGVLIGLLGILASFAYNQLDIIQNRQIPARGAAREMDSTLSTMHLYEQRFVSEASTPNIEFYLQQKSATVDAWETSYQQFESNYVKLLDFTDDPALKTSLQPVSAHLAEYRDTFLQLTKAYRERGFHSFGREGVLQQRSATLQANLQGRAQAQIALAKLQQAQSNFLLYKEGSAVTAFNDAAAALKAQLPTETDRVALDEYNRAFQEIVTIDRKIGLSGSEGLRGTLARQIATLTPIVKTAEAQVLASTNDRITLISRSFIVLAVTLGVIAIIMAIAIATFITRRLDQLLKASRRITSGNLDTRIPVETTDELGQLAASFNTMTIKLQEGQRSLRERAHDLTESVQRFELVSRAVNEAVYEWDIDSGSLQWGDGLVGVFGYHQNQRDGTIDWWTNHVHPDDAQAVNNSLDGRIKRKSSNWKAEYRFKKANGQYAYCQDRGFIEYENGKPVRMVGSIIDITRQKQLERAKDEFISIASHQLRTPLGSIRWNLELVTDKLNSLPRETAECIQEAYKSTLRMLGLVSDLLSVARIEQGRVQDIPEKTNLSEVINQAIGEMHPLASQRKININSQALRHVDDEVVIDPKRFREVVQNLLSNAVKYTPVGGKVTVGMARKHDALVISIADTGIGIPQEDHSSMFSKFFRAKNVTTTDTEGSGLGLFVVKSYVESWGGKIWFTSQLNKGTTFYISIPSKPRVHKQKS